MVKNRFAARGAPLGWLVAAALLVRGVSLALTPMVNPDSCRYINAAHRFLSGEVGLGLSYAGSLPTYPLLLVAVHALIPDWVLAGQVLSAACLALAVIPLYLLTRELFSPRAALWAGLALVLSPELNKYAGEIIREPVFALVFLWTVHVAAKALIEPAPRAFLAVSLLSLLAISLRFEMVAFMVGFPLVLIWQSVRERQSRRAWLKGLAVFTAPPALMLTVLLAVLLATPLDVRLGGGVNHFLSGLARLDLLGTYPEVYARLAAIEPSFPEARFAHDAVETTRHLLPLIYALGLVSALTASLSPLFVLLSAWGIMRRPPGGIPHRALLFVCGVFLLASYFVLVNRNFISDRYLLAPMLLLLPWVGWGMQELLERLGRSRGAKLWTGAAIALFLAIPAADTAGNWERGPGAQQIAGSWLRDNHAKPATRLLVNDERIALFGGYWMGEYRLHANDDLASIEASALDHGSNLIIVRTSRKKPGPIPELKRFKLVRTFEDQRSTVRCFAPLD